MFNKPATIPTSPSLSSFYSLSPLPSLTVSFFYSFFLLSVPLFLFLSLPLLSPSFSIFYSLFSLSVPLFLLLSIPPLSLPFSSLSLTQSLNGYLSLVYSHTRLNGATTLIITIKNATLSMMTLDNGT